MYSRYLTPSLNYRDLLDELVGNVEGDNAVLSLGERLGPAPTCSCPSLTPSLPVFPAEEDLTPKAAVQKELSDMDYLKSKMVKAELSSSSSEEESEDEAVNCEEGSEDEGEASSATPAQPEIERKGAGHEHGAPSGKEQPLEARAEVCGARVRPEDLGGSGEEVLLYFPRLLLSVGLGRQRR